MKWEIYYWENIWVKSGGSKESKIYGLCLVKAPFSFYSFLFKIA